LLHDFSPDRRLKDQLIPMTAAAASKAAAGPGPKARPRKWHASGAPVV
jgi:hypothetical protein